MREFVPITEELIKGYQDQKVSLRFLIIDTVGVRGIFESVYSLFVSDKSVVELGNLPVEEKNRIWLLVSNTAPERSQKDKISSCKCVHVIEQILNEKITKL